MKDFCPNIAIQTEDSKDACHTRVNSWGEDSFGKIPLARQKTVKISRWRQIDSNFPLMGHHFQSCTKQHIEETSRHWNLFFLSVNLIQLCSVRRELHGLFFLWDFHCQHTSNFLQRKYFQNVTSCSLFICLKPEAVYFQHLTQLAVTNLRGAPVEGYANQLHAVYRVCAKTEPLSWTPPPTQIFMTYIVIYLFFQCNSTNRTNNWYFYLNCLFIYSQKPQNVKEGLWLSLGAHAPKLSHWCS